MRHSFLLYLAFLLLLFQACQTEQQPEAPAAAPADKLAEKHEPYDALFLQRSYPDDYFDIDKLVSGIESAQLKNLEKSDIPGFDSDWVTRGPGNLGGRVNTIAVHPTNEDIIFAGFARGGVFRTKDGGQNWESLFDDQAYLAIGDIEIDPSNPEVIYVGTGDPNISGYPGIGNGLYRSTDGGDTWTFLGLREQRIISKIIIHPENPDIIYAGCMGLPFERNEDRGLYRSVDGGQTWTQILYVADEAGVIDMVMAPDDSDMLFAAGWDRIRNNRESYIAGENGGVFRSVDGGDNWVKLSNGLPQGTVCRIGLTISKMTPGRLWAMYVNPDGFQLQGIYRSDDYGENWVSINDDFIAGGLSGKALGGFGWYFGKLRVNPQDDNDIFLLGVDLWRTLDGGQNWYLTTPPWFQYIVHADKHDLVFTEQNNILLATDGGAYRTNIEAFEWEDIENLPVTDFYRVAYNPHQSDWYYGGAQDNGTSGGASVEQEWLRIWGGDGFQAAFHPDSSNFIYAESQFGGIVLSTDNGFNWDSATEGIDTLDQRNWDMQYILSPHNPDIMYTGTVRMYKSTDNGFFWFPISSDLTDGETSEFRRASITTVQESPITPGLLYAGTVDANVWRTDNDGGNWINITGDLPNRYVTDIKASPNFEDWLYVTHSGYRDNDFSPRVHRSKDRGLTWEPIAGDLPDLAINDIYVLPDYDDNILFVATDGGVYGTIDGGENWDRIGENMPFIPVYDLEWNVERNEIIAGTFARSIMTYPIDDILEANDIVSSVAEDQAIVEEFKLWPSPARSVVNVSFALSSIQTSYNLNVLNQNGQLVQALGQFDDGASTVQRQLPLNDLPSGTYYLQVVNAEGIFAAPFIKQ
ncbi:MAG: T9SS type A sorting domain-containing protein [Bacteroidota bacterium]